MTLTFLLSCFLIRPNVVVAFNVSVKDCLLKLIDVLACLRRYEQIVADDTLPC